MAPSPRTLRIAHTLFVIAAIAIAPQARADVRATPDTSASVPDPLVYLSWHQPHGIPGATENLTPSHGPDQRDTLWLTFEPRRTSKLYGMSAQLVFHAPVGDTLNDHWRFGGGTANLRNIVVEFPQGSWKMHGPWTTPGFGGAHFDRVGGTGRLDVIYAVNADSVGPVGNGERYAFARILFPSMTQAEAAQPVCIEWISGQISFAIGVPDASPGSGGSRFVSVGSPACAVCRTYREARKIAPFKPSEPMPTPAPKH